MSPPPPSIRPPHPPRPRRLLSRPSRNGPLDLHQRPADLITETRLALLMVMNGGCGAHGGSSSGGNHSLSVVPLAAVTAAAGGVGGVGGCHGCGVVSATAAEEAGAHGTGGPGAGHGGVGTTAAEHFVFFFFIGLGLRLRLCGV